MSDDGSRPPEPVPDDGGRDEDAAARSALGRARAAAKAKGLRPGMRPGSGSRRRGALDPDHASAPYGAGRDPVAVGDTLGRLLAERGWTGELSVAGVVGRWRELVGEQMAEHCAVESFSEGSLVVRADSTAWAMQVRLLIPQLERRIAEDIGEGVVTSVTVLGPEGPRWTRGQRSVRGRGPRDTYG